MTRLTLNLFGSPQLLCDGEVVDISLRKGLALVVYLAVTGQPHTRDAVATMFWPDGDQQSGRANVRRTLYRLNKTLGEDVLATTSETIELNPEIDVWIDTEVFRQHVITCLGTRDPIDDLDPACKARLTEAAALYTDDFLAGFTLPDSPAFDEWQFFQMESLRRSFARLLDQLAHTHEQRGSFDTAIEHARHRLALDPLHEPAHCRLMRLYAISGHRAAALRQYHECVRLLEEELGVPPDEATTELYEAVRAREIAPAHEDTSRTVATVSRPTPPPNNLPTQLTPFVGRDDELTALDRFIDDAGVRLVTIVGAGGMGKTRLALAVAERQLTRVDVFPNGVYLVSLASVDRVERIVPAIAEVFTLPFDAGGRQARSPRQQLLDYLHSKRLLLLLDNFEHLLASADLVTEILQAAPGVTLLITSRERLYLHEEHLLAIQGLDVPDVSIDAPEEVATYTAVQLFVQSARRVQHSFELTADNAGAVVRICRLTEGMPLGVDLAAAWLDVMPPGDIVSEIEQSLDFLETHVQNVPARQRSIRAVFDSTWNQLGDTERAVFAQLSVFRGGFTRDAARYVTDTDLRMLATLVDKSLVQYDASRDRYQIHHLLRQYGAAQLAQELAEEDGIRDRHSTYYCAALGRRQGDIEGAHKRSALRAIDLDIDNILAAWNYAVVRGAVVRLDQAMHALEHHSYWRGRFYEAEALFHHAVVAIEQQTSPAPEMEQPYRRVLAGLWARHANFSYLLGHWDRARGLFEQGLETLDELDDAGVDVRLDRAYILMKMADVTDELADAGHIFQQSLDLYRAAGHEWWAAGLLCHLGYVALAAGDYDEAREQFEASLAQYRSLGDRWQLGWVLDGLSNVLMHQNQLAEAERLARESLAIHREIGLRDRIADSLATLSWITLAAGNRDDAYALYKEALAIWDDLGVSPISTSATAVDAQPLTPRWFGDILNQRMTAVAADLPADVIAQALDHAESEEE